jgi:hypothetical protein
MILFLVSTRAVVASPPSMLLFSGFCVVFFLYFNVVFAVSL